MTREEWLLSATGVLRLRLFGTVGQTLPEVKVSVGFPAGSRATGNNSTIGQIWHGHATNDGIPQIFISPQIENAVEALEVLTHELVHACTPGAGHTGEFKRLALQVGLTGPMRATVAGPELKAKLEKLAAYLGDYPHAAVNLKDRKKQETKLLKVYCGKTGYSVRMTQKWIAAYGVPHCGCCGVRMEQENKGGAA